MNLVVKFCFCLYNVSCIKNIRINRKEVGFLERERRRKKKKKSNSFAIYIVIAAVLLLAVFLAYKAFNAAFSAGMGVMSEASGNGEQELGEEILVTIPEGASTKDIAEILHENGLIDSVIMFRINSRLGEYDGTYHQGDYLIAKGTGEEDIMKLLQSGVVYSESVKVTIPEGFTAWQIAKRLEENGLVTADEFINEMNTGDFEYDFLEGIPKRDNYLEGYLFPATYDIDKNADAHTIITMFLNRFQIAYDNILKNAPSDFSTDELVTIASLIESEVQVESERPIVAGVIYNRLEDGMLLQIDSTVQYALSTRNEVVTYDDLEVDSEYNTYKYKGLPLGPISNPGESSLMAAANPDENNYLYYVVKERGSGEHVFAETYDEFLKAKEAYKNSFN